MVGLRHRDGQALAPAVRCRANHRSCPLRLARKPGRGLKKAQCPHVLHSRCDRPNEGRNVNDHLNLGNEGRNEGRNAYPLSSVG
jgi:hypothetical protein